MRQGGTVIASERRQTGSERSAAEEELSFKHAACSLNTLGLMQDLLHARSC